MTCPHKDLYENVYSSINHHSSKLEMTINGKWIDKMWYSTEPLFKKKLFIFRGEEREKNIDVQEIH